MKTPRRTFIRRLTVATSGILTLPLLSNQRHDTKKNNMNDTPKAHPIKQLKALGFQWETADPFLFCVHHEDNYPSGNEKMEPEASLLQGRHIGQDFILKDGWRMYHGSTVPGFPGHPHRGFETITIVRKGIVDHADSTGASGRYGNGDVQWMTAGKGVQHSEMFPLVNNDEGNPLELFQIWLNLPKKSKMVEPHFSMLWNDTIPTIEHMDDQEHKTTIEVIAGTLGASSAPAPPPDSWANNTLNHVGIFNIHLEPNASYTLPATEAGVNRTVYYYEGNGLKINHTEVPNYHAAEVHPTQELTITNANESSKILILQGKPIDEPVVQHGPFVMNSREEIRQAFEDYHHTQFGGWPWERYDQVHDRHQPRFAKHADGTEEIKQ